MTFLLDHDAPDDLAFSLQALGHKIAYLRNILPIRTPDSQVLARAKIEGWIVITANRDDYLALAKTQPHCGIILLIRRKTRVAERAALVQLLDRAGESGIVNNINFA